MDLFTHAQDNSHSLGHRPLADMLRPQSLSDIIGQEHLLADGTPLRNMLNEKQMPSLLLWGPPGVGKTTLARLLANEVGAHMVTLSAVSAGVKDLRAVVEEAQEARKHYNRRTTVFIDEIHRFNKTQQDALLPHVERGDITLVGATTENPYFSVNPALRSRMLMVTLEAITPEALSTLLKRAVGKLNELSPHPVAIHKDAYAFMLRYANGDARSLLTLLDAAYWAAPRLTLDGEDAPRITILPEMLQALAPNVSRNSGKAGDGDSHFDLASAYQKSLRANDVDASLYWLAKLITYGEDPRFIARRMVVTAAEDVGMADPQAFVIAQNAARSIETLGMPEGRIPLALATAYIAKAPKSNHSYKALDAALSDINNGKDYPVPLHLRDTHYEGAKDLGHGEGYLYAHYHPDAKQPCLPDALVGHVYYEGNL
jgi:putative ATPase